MTHDDGLDTLERDPASVVTVGTFDGVHRGHQAILGYLMAQAQKRGGRSVVVSFDPHPRQVVQGIAVPLLTTVAERGVVLERLGIERYIVLPFTAAFAALSAEAFVEEVLVAKIGLKEIVVGYDHGFGRGRAGGAALLETLGEKHGFTVDVIPAQVVAAHVVSSTEIRHLLVDEGAVAAAGERLGRPYSLRGTVVQGAQRGRTIGFPTANLVPDDPRKVVPKAGVYAVRVALGEGPATHDAMMNIGRRPTFEGTGLHLEAHLLDFEGDLYGRTLRIEFFERLRDERKFSSVDALVEQLSQDRRRCMDALRAPRSGSGLTR